MAGLQQEVDPAEVGLDAARLRRADAYLDTHLHAGRLPGWLLLVTRHGRVAHLSTSGHRHVEAGLPVEADTLFRVYSMTKPVTSVAAMSLYEEGAFELTTPVSAFLPAYADLRVHTGGSDLRPTTEPVTEPVRIGHLLTHTSGLTYGFHRVHPSDARLRAAGYEWGMPEGVGLAEACDTWARVPLLFQPGAEWNYSLSTDVLGRVLEVVTGTPLDRVLADRVLDPLGMTDTRFGLSGPDDPALARLARLYLASPGGGLAPGDAMDAAFLSPPALLSGGGGLLSTARDYHRFTQMLRGAGELDGVRVLSPGTVAYMTRNHLPGGADLESFGRAIFAESPYRGVGFGLGFAVVLDPAAYRTLTSPGEYSWGGAASTAFWVDPVLDVTVVLLTQLLPSSTLPLRTVLRQLVVQSVTRPER